MGNPVEAFQEVITRLPVGATYTYHIGHLAVDSASSPSLTRIRMYASGLALMGRVSLTQQRKKVKVNVDGEDRVYVATHYMLKVKERINKLDFDVARKLHLDSLGE